MPQYPHVEVKTLLVSQLKDELSKRGLDTTGLKKDLADRLQKAQDLDISGGTEAAPLMDSTKNEALPPKEIVAAIDGPGAVRDKDGGENLEGKEEDPANKEETGSTEKGVDRGNGPEEGEGVGHVMVEGATETAQAIQDEVDTAAKDNDNDVVPKVFDEEVAEVIRKEELKEQMEGLTPSPPRAISPAPVSGQVTPRSRATSRIATPPPPTAGFPPSESGKRERESTGEDMEEAGPSKRSKATKTYDTPLPDSLSHLSHPPTATLYITNLKRPFTVGALHDFLEVPSDGPDSSLLPPPRNPFSSEDYPGVWVSGVKTHAYVTYTTMADALAAAERIESQTWPENTGGALHVEFIPDERVRDLVEREEAAWANGRQKLALQITKTESGHDFTFAGSGAIGARSNGRTPYAPPLTGRGAVGPNIGLGTGVGFQDRRFSGGRAPPGAPAGPSGMRGPGGVHANGANGYSPVVLQRGGRSSGFERDGPVRGGFGNAGPGFKRTRIQPSLTYREGPAATSTRR